MHEMTMTDRPRAFEPSRATMPEPVRVPGWDMGPERRIDDGRSLARTLGWASIGLGLAEVLMPERITQFLGVNEERSGFVRMMGMREIAQGVAILSMDDPTPGIYARVAGDALDLAALGTTMGAENANRGNISTAMAMVAGITALDVLCAKQLTENEARR